VHGASRERGDEGDAMIADIKKTEPKILIIDIETSPNLAYTWGLFKANIGINQIEESGEVICFAAKWLGDRKTLFYSTHHDGKEDMLTAAWNLLDEADIVIGYNHVQFDMKHLRREFLESGFTPPSRWKDIDLLQVVRREFRFTSNKLDYVSQQLGLGKKVSHVGFDLWLACIRGDDKAWNTMKRYNRQDVILTEELYNTLLPWITGHPHRGLFTGVEDCCPNCGGTDLTDTGQIVATTRAYPTFVCEACGYRGKFSKSHRRTSTQ